MGIEQSDELPDARREETLTSVVVKVVGGVGIVAALEPFTQPLEHVFDWGEYRLKNRSLGKPRAPLTSIQLVKSMAYTSTFHFSLESSCIDHPVTSCIWVM